MIVELRGRQISCFDLPDQRQRDLASKIDGIIARNRIARRLTGIVPALAEQLDRQLVERRNFVVLWQRLEMLLVRRRERAIVRNRPSACVGASSHEQGRGKSDAGKNRTWGKISEHDRPPETSQPPRRKKF